MTEPIATALDAGGDTSREASAQERAVGNAPMNWRWWSLALRGVVAILFGILAVTSPAATFLSLVLLFGVFAIIDGVLALYVAAHTHAGGWIVARGLVSIAGGLIVLMWPALSSLALLLVIASWAVASGGLEIAMAIRHRERIPHIGLLVLDGALSIAFGIVLFLSPLTGAIVLGLWVGAFALVLGVVLLTAAWRARGDAHTHGGILAHA